MRAGLERTFDYLLAASISSWAVLGWISTPGPPTPTRAGISLLHLTVAYGIFRRAPVEKIGSPRAIAAAVPALVVAGLAFRWAGPATSWSPLAELVFLVGASLAIWTFISLGESFAVLPARRSIVASGPYRLVRHPAYAGEILMIAACAISSGALIAWAFVGAAIPLVALRIRVEEQLLSRTNDYRRYQATVRYKLIPCLW